MKTPVLATFSKRTCLLPTSFPRSLLTIFMTLPTQQYYEKQVRNILDTTVAALMANKDRQFMYVEMYYFHRWWTDSRTTDQQRQNLRTLLKNGQWEFIEGGWVMPDEATTTYSANIDQLLEGHLFLNRTFGITPTTGWQIDPFGASSALATHYRMAGFNFHIIDRINYKVHDKLVAEQAMEFWWQSSEAEPAQAIFTHILDENYCQPMNSGFDFEGDPVHNPPVKNNNLKDRAFEYARQIRKRQPIWRTPHIMILHQCDFKYQDAFAQFDNMDKILGFIRDNPTVFNMTIRWSKPSTYLKALSTEPSSIWPTRSAQDFFSYDDNKNSWWTGYFTSRPELKGIVRQSEAELRVVDNLASLFSITGRDQSGQPASIEQLHQAMGCAQHHDAVSGTEKQAVAENYATLLYRARAKTTPLIQSYLSQLVTPSGAPYATFTNTSTLVQNLAPGGNVSVLIYNSLYKRRFEVVKIPVWHYDVQVFRPSGGMYRSQVLPAFDPSPTDAPYTLFISAVPVPPAGFVTLRLSRPLRPTLPEPIKGTSYGTVANHYLSVTVGRNGLINDVTILNPNTPLPFSQYIMAYDSYPGPGQASGAYIFRPVGPAEFVDTTGPVTTIRETPLVKEIHQRFSPWASQVLRLYNTSIGAGNYIEAEYRIGPIPGNKEVITRFDTGLFTLRGDIYTDDNGFQMLHRTWDNEDELLIPANFYPSVYASYIQPSVKGKPTGVQLAVVNDRSHGVSSQAGGTMEFMMHRRLLQDDDRGVDEALNDTSIITPSQRWLFYPPGTSETSRHRDHHIEELNYPLGIYYTQMSNYEATYVTWFEQALPLPSGIHVLHTRLISATSPQVLVSITNVYTPEDKGNDYYINVDPTTMFGTPVCNVVQTSLTGMHVIGPVNGPVPVYVKHIVTFIITPC